MPSSVRRLAVLACLLAGTGCMAGDLDVNPTVKNWVQPLFTKEGFHKLTLKGGSMTPATRDEVHVIDLNVTVFSDQSPMKIETIILSPSATFLISEKFAKGKDLVRLIRDDLDVTGYDWTYDANTEKVSLARNARVVFHAALPNFLK